MSLGNLARLLDSQEDLDLGITDDLAASAPEPLHPPRKRHSGPLNARYLAFIRQQPCCVCGSCRGVEAAHTGPRGLGQKAPDADAIPLCRGHHQTRNDSLHKLGPRRFAERHALNVPAAIRHLNQIGKRYLDDAHRPGRAERSPEFVRLHCACGWRTAWYRDEQDARAVLGNHLKECL